jgi:hypothetical protein
MGSPEQPAKPRSNRAEKIEQLSAKLSGAVPATRKGWRDYLPRLDREGRKERVEIGSHPDIELSGVPGAGLG